MTDKTVKESFMAGIKDYAKNIDQYLMEQLKGQEKNLWDAARHYISGGGKRLRPFMVLKSYELVGKKSSDIIPIASALEILHTFTLIHDDIMDKDDTRRGVPSVHAKWGEPIAILAGDLLYSMVFVLVYNANIPDGAKARIMKELGAVSVELCEGQTMDISFENRDDVTIEEYMDMISKKTGALFKCSAYVGGYAANESEEQLSNLKLYGQKLGIAFQLVDDILGLTADEKKLGKPIFSDLREGKKTYLVLYALENLDPTESAQLKQIIFAPEKSESDIQKAFELIQKSGAIEKARKLAEKYIDETIELLKVFPESKARKDLENLAKLAIGRDF